MNNIIQVSSTGRIRGSKILSMSNESSMKKCVDCGQTGHTSTACNNGKVGIIYLFGVRIDPTAVECENDGLNYEPKSLAEDVNINKHDNERNSRIDVEDLCDEHSHDKKKGVPWTEEEHKAFLIGLEQLGRGQWRAISKNFVPSRTPTQVASHAQKFYIRLKSTEDKRKRRTSLFDIPLDEYSRGPGASVRPPAAPMAGTYGVEGYNRFPDMMGYNRNEVHIPLMSYMYDESVHPLNQSTERFSTLVPRPLLITNAKRWSTQEPELEKTNN